MKGIVTNPREAPNAPYKLVFEFVDLHGLPDDYLSSYVRRLYAVSPADVQRMAQKYIQDDKATIVVVGDKKVIEEQIKPYGTITP